MKNSFKIISIFSIALAFVGCADKSAIITENGNDEKTVIQRTVITENAGKPMDPLILDLCDKANALFAKRGMRYRIFDESKASKGAAGESNPSYYLISRSIVARIW
jgi:hypothetical protein